MNSLVNRFEVTPSSATMMAVVTTGTGGYDKLKFCKVPLPEPRPHEVLLKRGGRYVSSGAIAGPVVSLDMRDMYLKDITLIGCTAWDEPVFADLVGYIERGEIKPLLAKVYPLEQIAQAQREFMKKEHIGNFVLVPPAV